MFGKFFGLVGVWFGFVIGLMWMIDCICDCFGSWLVFLIVFVIGIVVYCDVDWIVVMCVDFWCCVDVFD